MLLRSSLIVGLSLLAGCSREHASVQPPSEPPSALVESIGQSPTAAPDADAPQATTAGGEPAAGGIEPAPAVNETPPVTTVAPPATRENSAVDLAPHAAEIEKMLAAAVAKFSREHPTETASLLVFGYSGFNPSLMIAIDTPEHSAAFVERHPDNCGRDEQGRFCNSPYDCAYPLDEYSFNGFPNLYEVEWPLHMKLPDGQVIAVDTTNLGDEAMNEAMLNFLTPILQQSQEYQKLKRAPVFRLGVHAENSHRENFWIPKTADK